MIDHIDHIVLTTSRTEQCIDFYTRVLGMKFERFGDGRMALKFGEQKINLHEKGKEFEPKAHVPVPGGLDLCFIAGVPLEEVMARLNAAGVPIIEGPVMKTGACYAIRSVYVRDPDLNLIEISERAA
jgi:catechol 2,3-dioxygenase-like lactoylglutathione lyase family enzyme